jgi:hypothetical protein
MRLIFNYHAQSAAIYGRAVEKLAELFSSDQIEESRVELRKLIEKVVIYPRARSSPVK